MRIFLLAFMALVTFSNISCQRTTAAPAPAGVINPEASVANSEGTPTSIALPEIEITRFTPLDENERFAFARDNIEVPPPIWGMDILTLYAIRNNDIENRRELFTWEDVTEGHIQFSHDFRKAFFSTRQRELIPPTSLQSFYKVNGSTGEVKRLPIEVEPRWRITQDGRFVAFINRWLLSDTGETTGRWDREQANIFVFDSETETMTQLTWRTNMPIESGWTLYRLGNIFRVFGGHTSFALAATELDPATLELRTLWDMTDWDIVDPADRISPPDISTEPWIDDVLWPNQNLTVRLR